MDRHRAGSEFHASVWSASKVSSVTRSWRPFSSACESRMGAELSLVPWRTSVGLVSAELGCVKVFGQGL